MAAVTALLRAENLTKRYGDVVALDGASFEVSEGVTGLLGANGSGKSTTIKLFLGLLHPTSGAAEVLGENPHETVDGLDSLPRIALRLSIRASHLVVANATPHPRRCVDGASCHSFGSYCRSGVIGIRTRNVAEARRTTVVPLTLRECENKRRLTFGLSQRSAGLFFADRVIAKRSASLYGSWLLRPAASSCLAAVFRARHLQLLQHLDHQMQR